MNNPVSFEEAVALAERLAVTRPPIHHPVTREEVERILAKVRTAPFTGASRSASRKEVDAVLTVTR
jgi:hypothetical protein